MEEKNKHQIVQRMEKIDSILDEYEVSLGLAKFNEDFGNAQEAQKYLSLSRDQIEKMGIDECAEAAYILGSLAFHISRSINREQSRLNWAKSSIREIICTKAHSYNGAWSNQDMQAILDNDVSRKLNDICKYCQQRIDRLNYLSSSIKNISDLFINLQRAKVSHHG